MSTRPDSTEPLDRAIIDLLTSIPPKWREHDASEFSSSQEKALVLLFRAALIESRQWIEFRLEHQPEWVETTVVRSGEGINRVEHDHYFRLLPHWFDESRRIRGLGKRTVSRTEIRLSERGELTLYEYRNSSKDITSAVVSFVRRTGEFANLPPEPPQYQVENCIVHVAERSANPHGAPAQAATAMAPAKGGDIVIQNHNVIKVDDAVVAAQGMSQLKKLETPDAGPPDRRAQGEGADPRVTPKPPLKPLTLTPAATRAGESLEWVRRERPELVPEADATSDGKPVRYTPAQYEHIREYECPAYPRDADGRPTLPSLESWMRYVREYLLFKDGPTNGPRGGRTGRSVVSPDQVERRQNDV